MEKLNEFEGFKVVSAETDTKFSDNVLDMVDEHEMLANKELIKKNTFIKINEKNKLEPAIAGDRVYIKLSQKGTIYFLDKNKDYIPHRSAEYRALIEALVEKFFTGDVIVLGKEYLKLRMPDGGVWYSDGYRIGNKEWFDTVVRNFSKSSLKELNKEYSSLTRNPRVGERDEVYGDNPENFVSREAEMLEFLSVLLQLKGSRKLLPEEIELLNEIREEIDDMLDI